MFDWLFNIIAVPFGYVMQFCYWVAQENYILALLLFSFIIEIVMLPFAVKQQKNSIKAASLRPKEAAIRKKYAGRNDQPTQQKMMQEIQEMQQKEGYSPFGGCLPMLIQMPVIMALYNIVYNPFKYIVGMSNESIQMLIDKVKELGGDGAVSGVSITRNINLISKIKEYGLSAFSGNAEFVEKVPELDKLPNMGIGSFDLGGVPNITAPSWLLLIPVLTFLAYFFSSKLSRKFIYQPTQGATDQQAACSNNMMDFTMPLMSVFFTFMVPGAIGLYWIFRSLLGTFKSFLMSKIMPLPKFTEEDYKEAEKAYLGKSGSKTAKKERDPNAPKVRSLHHIDDDDCESYEEQKKKVEEIEAAREQKKAAQTAEELSIERAPVKKYEREIDESKYKKNKKNNK